MFNISGTLRFFVWIQITIWRHFLSVWRTSLHISYMTDLWMISSLCLCLSRSVFILFSLWKNCFISYRSLGWWFSFSTSNMLSHCLQASVVFQMRSQPLIIVVLPCTWWVVFLLLPLRFSFSLSLSRIWLCFV